MRHVGETELALYTSGDVNLLRRVTLRLHLSKCERCRVRAEEYRADREVLRDSLDQLPAGVNWDRLAAEMSANIRVGLAAGECVTPAKKHKAVVRPQFSWGPVGVVAGAVLLLAAAWWLNVPGGTGGPRLVIPDDRAPMVQVSNAGVELRANGGSLAVSGAGAALPVSVSVSMQGTARARYVDADTAQVTITSVYVQ